MEEVAVIIILCISVAYMTLLFFSFSRWKFESEKINLSVLPSVTLIIPFRNEQEVLEQLFNSINQLSYSNLDVVLINDHSTDDSVRIFDQFNFSKNVRLIHMKKDLTGKKQALTEGIANAQSELVVFSDADCVFTVNWIESMVTEFVRGDYDWLSGPVSHSIFPGWASYFQKLESSYLQMILSWCILSKIPTTCSGANIMLRKKLFEELKGFQGIDGTPSGDDELFMQKAKKSGFKLGFNFSKDSLVRTQGVESFGEILNQRLRWGSKLSHNVLPYNLLLAALVFFFHVGSVALLILDYKLALIVLSLRLVFEFYGMVKAIYTLKLPWRVEYFLISFFVYPLYAIFMAGYTQFKRYTWKDRKF